jgi:hypothetical protein
MQTKPVKDLLGNPELYDFNSEPRLKKTSSNLRQFNNLSMVIFGLCSLGVKKNLKSGVACFRLFEAEAKAKASFGSRPLDENFLV